MTDKMTPSDFIANRKERLLENISDSLETLERLETLEIKETVNYDQWIDPDTQDPGVLTLETAKSLERDQILYSLYYCNADQTPQRFRVNGQVKIWKTRPDHVKIPVKRGLYEYGYIWHYDLSDFSLSETFASLDHDQESEIDIWKKESRSEIRSLQDFCYVTGHHIDSFVSDSGHDWIRPAKLSDSQEIMIKSLSWISRGLSLYLRSIWRDLETGENDKLLKDNLEILRSSHVYISSLFGDFKTLTDPEIFVVGSDLREIGVETAGQDLRVGLSNSQTV